MIIVRTGVTIFFLLQALMFPGAANATPTPPAVFSVMELGVPLAEPLIAVSPTSTQEDTALAQALNTYQRRGDATDVSPLVDFTVTYPTSGWNPSILTNLGLTYLHNGHFTKAIKAFEEAWHNGKFSEEPQAKAMVDRALGELARLRANLGHDHELAQLLKDMGNRPVMGSATEAIQSAREQLILVKDDPRHLFNCGPLALRTLMLKENASPDAVNFLQFYRAGEDGTTLAELGGLATSLKLEHRLIFRQPGQTVPIPSIVHWKVGHFASIIGEANGRYQVRDAVFAGTDIWVTKAALEEESTGYFLIPNNQPSDESWRIVDVPEASSIRGKGPTNGPRPGGAGDPTANGGAGGGAGGDGNGPGGAGGGAGAGAGGGPDGDGPGAGAGAGAGAGPGAGAGCPLCTYDIKEASVSLTLSDVPVGYIPAFGPAMKVRISYNQREDSQPANFSFFNVSPKWSIDWLTYVIDDPSNPGANVSRYMSGGGAFYYLNYNATSRRFAAQDDDGSILSIVSQSPVTYRRQLRDGRVEIYSESDGSTAYPRRTFLSQVIDPQGNAATLHYDAQRRLTSITDAVGRNTTFSYTATGRPLLVTRITDPFGRSASISYDGQGRLSSITDIIGLTSTVTYDANSLVDTLTTPYGTTRFTFTAPGTVKPRFVQVTDPLGYKEREEWLEPAPIPASDPASTVPTDMPLTPSNSYLTYRNSFHWDKVAYAAAGCTDSGGCDYSKARLRHFVHMPGTSIKGTAIESSKNALENRVWYNYPGQTSSVGSIYGGTYSQPIAIGRVLDDGTTQISRYEYDQANFFNMTKAVDPIGRTTNYSYSNGIDLVAISQTSELGVQETLAQYIYNSRHRPIFYANAAGQSYSYAYNAAGQMTSITDPLGQKTSYQYDANGNLTTVTNANSVVSESYTYDGFARIRTFTDSEGWTVTADYDAADRLTRLTYPDGTGETFGYDKLDLASYRDREGRTWAYDHDADHRLVKFTHPSGRVVQLGYNGQNLVTSLVDPNGNVTKWSYDVQGRASGKEYADGSQELYVYEQTISRLRSVIDALNQTKQFGYATDNKLLATSYINAVNTTPNVTFTHDPFYPRVKTMIDGVGTTSYDYVDVAANGALSLQQECFVATGASTCSHTIDYVYNKLNRLAGRTIQGSSPETLSYDAINRVTRHTSDLGAFNISYLGQTSQITRSKLDTPGGNLETTWSYLNNLGDRRLSAISNKGLAVGQFTDFAFTTSPENLITGITQNSDATVEIPNPPAQTVNFNELNQITSLSGQIFTYDANGNLLTDETRTYSWDAENRLIGINFANKPDRHVTYRYDGIGRRIAIGDGSGDSAAARKFVWCGSKLCQARDENYAVERSYHEEGEAAASEGDLYYGRDQIGSVRRIFKTATEAPVVDYDPYGVKLQTPTAMDVDFGFAKMFNADPAGNYLTWYRGFQPELGRWLSRDRLGETADAAGNLYSYAFLNPLLYTDSLGLFPRPTPSGLPCSSSDPSTPSGDPADPANWKRCLIQLCVAAGLMTNNPFQPQRPSIEDIPHPQTDVTMPDRRRPDDKK